MGGGGKCLMMLSKKSYNILIFAQYDWQAWVRWTDVLSWPQLGCFSSFQKELNGSAPNLIQMLAGARKLCRVDNKQSLRALRMEIFFK